MLAQRSPLLAGFLLDFEVFGQNDLTRPRPQARFPQSYLTRTLNITPIVVTIERDTYGTAYRDEAVLRLHRSLEQKLQEH